MIKCDKSEIEMDGEILDLLAETSLILGSLMKMLEKDLGSEFVKAAIKSVLHAACEVAEPEEGEWENG